MSQSRRSSSLTTGPPAEPLEPLEPLEAFKALSVGHLDGSDGLNAEEMDRSVDNCNVRE